MNALLNPASGFVVLALAVWGLAWVIADSKISLPIRKEIAKITGPKSLILAGIECPPCLSFWLGFSGAIATDCDFGSAIVFAFACVGVSILLWSYVNRVQ